MSAQMPLKSSENNNYKGSLVSESTWLDYYNNNTGYGGLMYGYTDATKHIVDHIEKMMESPEISSFDDFKLHLLEFCQQRKEFSDYLKSHENPIP